MDRHRIWLVTLPLLAGLAQAQQPRTNWSEANRQVAEFPRGHADVVKWEQAKRLPPAQSEAQTATLVLADIDEAIRLAWRPHTGLAAPLNRLGKADTALIASGQWHALSAHRVLGIADSAEVLEVAHATRKTLLGAIAQVQARPYQQQVVQAAEAGAELGERMAEVGNWSKLQAARQQLVKTQATQQWQRDRYAAELGEATVLKALGQWTRNPAQTLQLPAKLPALPAEPINERLVQERVQSVAARLPKSESITLSVNATLAYQAYRTAYTLARSQLDDSLRLHQLIYDETALRYNGMLLNTWNLLEEARALAGARVAAIDATRDFWLADADLQWIMLGGKPEPLALAGADSGTGTASAGH
ncbi:hypothetical protein [Craterilacuibacter sp.]|uniref:hypothetical protein n=1 Tax=Craterilacuibacter sp. TaxID=2870909 RepID=UPI003F340751